MKQITPHLWFDNQAEEAVAFYISIFKDSKIHWTSQFPETGKEIHKRPPGSIMTIDFTLNGQRFLALNGGPIFKFNEAVSFVIPCIDQDEVDHYWDALSAGGDPEAQQCGWLKDKYGLSWQVVPDTLGQLLADPAQRERVMGNMMQMKKIKIAKLTA